MRFHADSLELRRLRYDLIYTYKVVFGLVNSGLSAIAEHLVNLVHEELAERRDKLRTFGVVVRNSLVVV